MHCPKLRTRFDRASQCQSVHERHLGVDKGESIRVARGSSLMELRQGLFAAAGAFTSETPTDDLLVQRVAAGGVVIDDEHPSRHWWTGFRYRRGRDLFLQTAS